MYYLGQAFGILSTICCLILPLLPKKWQMLVMNAAVNVFCALNLILIGQVGPMLIVYAVAVFQVIVALRHLQNGRSVTTTENLLFLFLYISCCFFGLHSIIDVLPIVGAVFNMLATFQKDVQKTRALIFLNASSFFTFYLLVGSTAVLSSVCTMTTTVIGMYRHHKQTA